MTATSALLFYDQEAISRELANTYVKALAIKIPNLENSRTINFYSSKLEDLTLVSKYRVVSLPTLILTDPSNRIVMRCATFLPDIDDLIHRLGFNTDDQA